MAEDDPDPPFPRLPRRRRLLIALIAVATAVTVVTTLLSPPGGVQRKRVVGPDAAFCSPGQTRACVGGQVDVISPATGASASAPH